MSTGKFVIWKFVLPVGTGEFTVPMPICADIVSIGPQGDRICVWAIVDPAEKKKSDKRFRVVMTGEGFVMDNLRHMSTVSLFDGKIIAHVFGEI